jgi:hypothetical protein
MPCIAPSEILVTSAAKDFGAAAEAIVQKEYLSSVGRAAFFPASQTDFVDISHGFGNQQLYIAFLAANHPNLSVEQLAAMAAERDVLKIPDVMTSDAPRRTEFYEIKPNSVSGLREGNEKVAWIDAARTSLGLPYVPGTQFPAPAPDKRVLIYAGKPLGARLEVFFRYERVRPGLIVYEVCAEGEFERLGLEVLKLIIVMIMVLLIKRLPVPPTGPVPVPPVIG